MIFAIFYFFSPENWPRLCAWLVQIWIPHQSRGTFRERHQMLSTPNSTSKYVEFDKLHNIFVKVFTLEIFRKVPYSVLEGLSWNNVKIWNQMQILFSIPYFVIREMLSLLWAGTQFPSSTEQTFQNWLPCRCHSPPPMTTWSWCVWCLCPELSGAFGASGVLALVCIGPCDATHAAAV